MGKYSPRETDPVRYEKVKLEQEQLSKECATHLMLARICPYCNHKIELLYRGTHGASKQKCSACGEEVIFPPVAFRTA